MQPDEDLLAIDGLAARTDRLLAAMIATPPEQWPALICEALGAALLDGRGQAIGYVCELGRWIGEEAERGTVPAGYDALQAVKLCHTIANGIKGLSWGDASPLPTPAGVVLSS